MIDLHHGECLEVMRTLADASVDAVVTDPPAGIGFMGKEWDAFGGRCSKTSEHDRKAAYNKIGKGAQPFGYSGSSINSQARDAFTDFLTARLAEALRVAKPGAHLLCWAIPRTSHWTGTAIEDAGWIIEDRISHLFGTGFPKHKSKLKPACEDWWLATKPGGTKWLNVAGCKIGCSEPRMAYREPAEKSLNTYGNGLNGGKANGTTTSGRWPANVVLDEEAAAALDRQNGVRTSGKAGPNGHTRNQPPGNGIYGNGDGLWSEAGPAGHLFGDSGGASRFFYCAKASRKDRDEGLDGIESVVVELIHPTVTSEDESKWESGVRRVQLLVDTAISPPRVITASGTEQVSEAEWSMFLFGNGTTAQSQKECKSTTRTRTSSTTESRTLSWLTRCTTSAFTVDVCSEMGNGSSTAGSVEPNTRSVIITSARTVSLSGVGRVPSRTRLRITHAGSGNIHPTCKSTDLMRWLCRLVTPEGGVILDPFMGSGSTGKAAMLEGFGFIGIESDIESFATAERRIGAARPELPLFASGAHS